MFFNNYLNITKDQNKKEIIKKLIKDYDEFTYSESMIIYTFLFNSQSYLNEKEIISRAYYNGEIFKHIESFKTCVENNFSVESVTKAFQTLIKKPKVFLAKIYGTDKYVLIKYGSNTIPRINVIKHSSESK